MRRFIFPRRPQGGFSLIEILIGIVLGMITVIIIMRLFAGSEASKRATTGGSDAQINGSVALYNLQNAIRSSGYGISSFQILGCSLRYNTTSAPAVAVTVPLVPVAINLPQIPAGDANTDTLFVFSGNSNFSTGGDQIVAASTSGPGGSYTLNTPMAYGNNGLNIRDYVIPQLATRPVNCALNLDRLNGLAAGTANRFNAALGPVAAYPQGSIMFNLAQANSQPFITAYAVRNGNLTACNYFTNDCGNAANVANAAVWVPIASNIVSMRAAYGRDATPGNMSGQLNGINGVYDQTLPAGAAGVTAGPTSLQCAWARVLTLRMVLVARSEQYDKTAPTAVAPSWDGSLTVVAGANTPSNVALPIVLTGNANWKNYRYKTLQTVVPLRSLMWSGANGGVGGC